MNIIEKDRVQRIVAELVVMHNNPPKRLGWMEQSTLASACHLLVDLKHALNWYADEAAAIAQNSMTKNTITMMASMQVLALALDGGQYAAKVLKVQIP